MRKAGFKPLQFEIGLTSLICVLLMLSLGCVGAFFEKKGVEVLKLPPSSHTLAIDTLHGSVSRLPAIAFRKLKKYSEKNVHFEEQVRFLN